MKYAEFIVWMFDCQLLINNVTILWSERVNMHDLIAMLINILISNFADYFVFAEGYCLRDVALYVLPCEFIYALVCGSFSDAVSSSDHAASNVNVAPTVGGEGQILSDIQAIFRKEKIKQLNISIRIIGYRNETY
jgi:hypothetical protein